MGSDDEREKYKSIKVYESTYDRLQSHGNMGESFDDLINRILDIYENGSKDTENE
ncbi:DUF7557 family protein [Halogeometricum borinquense]|uniref:DUF7557 family protein n=1 Tax=Halogeometricum borinquense TaxID=60847 RepID=UPI00343C38EB